VGKRFPTSLTDEPWQILAPLSAREGRHRMTDLREAIRFSQTVQ
jgi:hypothetical protein